MHTRRHAHKTSPQVLWTGLCAVVLLSAPACGDKDGGNGGGNDDGTGSDSGSEQGSGSMELVATFSDIPAGMESDDDFIYLLEGVEDASDTSRLMAISKSDFSVTELGVVEGFTLAIDSENLYWFSYADGLYTSVQSMPKTGGEVTTVASGLTWDYICMDIVSDETSLFMVGSTLGDGGVATVPIGGGTVSSIGSGIDDLCHVQVDGDYVYGVAGPVRASLYRVPKTGGDFEELATSDQVQQKLTSGAYGEMEIASGTLYWTNDYHNQYGNGAITAAPADGGAMEDLAIQQDSPVDLVVHDGDLFWVNEANFYSEDGQVMQLLAGSDEEEVLVEGLARPYYLQVDDTHIYFTSQDPDGTFSGDVGYVYRIAR